MDEERKIVIASDSGISIRSFKDISQALNACFDATGILLSENDLSPEFFDLRSGLMGEFFQKFTNYKLKIAVVLQNPKAYGERFSELVYEHRSHNMIRFLATKDEAETWLLS
jgi:hypothetical protein